MKKPKIAVVAALAIAGIVTPVCIQHQEQVKLRRENDVLRQSAEQVAPLKAENTRLAKIIAELPRQTAAPDDSSSEVLRLRGEVARLREDSRELARLKTAGTSPAPTLAVDNSFDAAAQNLALRAAQLRDRLERAPQMTIPEMQFLTEKDWLNAGGSVKQLDNDDDYRRALGSLRSRAKGVFGGMMQKAVRQYVEANGGTLPTEMAQLQPYMNPPADPALLDRYGLVASGTLSDAQRGRTIITEKAPPLDNEFDSHFEFSLNSSYSHTVNKNGDALEAAAVAYAQANKGLLPFEPSQITPYLKDPIDPGVVQDFLTHRLPRPTPVDQSRLIK
jgi:hypothetical protein